MEFANLGMKSYLLPKDQCGYIGNERELKGAKDIKVYKSIHGSFRYIKTVNGRPVSVLQVMFDGHTAQVANVFTVEEERRKEHAKELFFLAKKRFSKIYHSGNLSPIGKCFADKIN